MNFFRWTLMHRCQLDLVLMCMMIKSLELGEAKMKSLLPKELPDLSLAPRAPGQRSHVSEAYSPVGLDTESTNISQRINNVLPHTNLGNYF